ncbi:MAG: SulP family inorganic anion transporter [Planctomycetota bacterium]|nr:SulP family inorganic anion transporter [Planctomycetota bacterium]MDW8372673.1 SulP family inorganic anion transporter [Planctomycetota bacterium]
MADSSPVFYPALLRELRRGYTASDFCADLLAGLIVGIIALPLSIGLAIASGVPPQYGLATAIIGGFLISLLGGSRVQIGGPAGAFVGLCAAGIATHGHQGLLLATLLAGAIMIVFGLCRFGRAIAFIPIPVVVGFTSGIAVIIATTQIAPLTGIPDRSFAHTDERLAWIWQHRQDIQLTPLLLGLASCALILALRRWRPLWPGALIAVVAGTLTSALAGWERDGTLRTIGTAFGEIPHGLPPFALPNFSADGTWSGLFRTLHDIGGLAMAIALLGSIESLLSAVVADGLSGDRHDGNTELIAQGIANLAVPLFGGLPATGVIARTSANIRAGARSPIAGIVHALTVLAIVLVAAPLVVHIPLAVLAGVLLSVAWGMSELRHWPHILRAGRSDAFLLPLAFLLTVFVDLAWAVTVGVLLAMFFFVRRMSESVQIERRAADSGMAEERAPELPPGVEVYDVRGPFFFGAATLIRDIDERIGERPAALILRLRNVPFIDATAAFSLRELLASCRRRRAALLISECHTRPLADLERHGLLRELGEGQVFASYEAALAAATEIATARRLSKTRLRTTQKPATQRSCS